METHQELQLVVELLANLTEAHTAALFLRSPGENHFYVAAHHTLAHSFKRHVSIEPGEGVVGYVAKHRVPVDVDRYKQDATATGLYEDDEGVKAFVAMPVGENGVLVVDTKARRIFGEREKKAVRDMARFLESLLRVQATCAREALYGRILDLLYDVENAALGYKDPKSFYAEALDAGRRYTGLTMGVLCQLLPGSKQFSVTAVQGPAMSPMRGRSFPVSQGLIGWVIRENRPLTHSRVRPMKGKSYLISPDEPTKGYNAFIGVPLYAWKRVIGVWAFAGHTERHLSNEEEQALQLAGNRMAGAMEHYGLLVLPKS
jgi:signal transduction protein with GAF and PtsI domain